MNDAAQLDLIAPRHLNQGLFSDYYLDQIVPTLPEWTREGEAYQRLIGLREQLRARLESLKPEALDEAQLEEAWVKPVLEALGHHWSVQVKIRYRDKGFRKPDYVFTERAEDARALTNRIYEAAELAHTLAIGDAKRWGTRLDQGSGDERNPSQQIDEYLRYSERPWGILTDGRIWRLYHRDRSKDNAFYAVDLPALLTSRAERATDHFLYFVQFFQRESFSPGGWLERVLRGSEDYAEGLSDALEQEVYTALELIAQGFLNYRRNRLTPDAATLRQIYEQSLVLLYRLLFIFYAESRDVLPLSTNKLYSDHQSLYAIARRVKDRMERPTSLRLAVDKSEVYALLSDLFFIIDSGSKEYEIAPYNGRLFSAVDHPFLADKYVGDAFLVEAVDRLARVPDRNNPRNRVFVDYRDLDVRHLGAIYEKLLEYTLEVASEPLTVKGGKYVPAGPGETALKQPGEVYLRTGNNERKVTGSYYTPDYIVRFIVEKTLEPLLTEITARHAELDADGHWQVRDAEGLRRDILAVNVLDPATGSGHFMVEVVGYMAEWLRRLGLNPSDLGADEDELVYWKRQVVTSCVYGVDVNPLAVELARLSLWLTTLSRGRPLSFLDHHIRLGNTLVGARAAEIQADLPNGTTRRSQPCLFEDSAFIETLGGAVRQMSVIEHTIATTVKDVKEQEALYDELKQTTYPLRVLANVWTARHFGFQIEPEVWEALYTSNVKQDGTVRVSNEAEALIPVRTDEANKLAADHRFFHWELEFPEVFFDAEGKPLAEPGFDAVVGNPPYVRQERIQPIKPYLERHYAVYSGTADLYLYFYERALKLVKPGKRVGYITSGTFMNSHSAAPFRAFLREQAAFEYAVNFGENQPFKGAEMVYPTMLVFQRGKAQPTFRGLFVEEVYRHSELEQALKLPMDEVAAEALALPEWRFQPAALTRLFQKITAGKQTLGEAVDGRLYRGVVTGLNEAFIIDGATRERLIAEHPSSAEVIKPMLRGEDLRPWYQIEGGEYLVFTRQGIEIEKYPAIKRHLEKFRNRLEPKPDGWDVQKQGEWKGRAAGKYEWFELQTTAAYHEMFDEFNICWPDIAKLPRFSWSQHNYFNNTVYTIPKASWSLLGIMQSRTMWFVISQVAQPLRLRAGLWQYRLFTQFMERLPIPALTAAQESALGALAEEITGLARERYALDEGVRRRIQADLGEGGKLNTALEAWWELADFGAFRGAVQKAFKADVPLKARDEWEAYLADRRGRHAALTAQIVERETRLNAVVHAAFELTAEEQALIEKATKYPYGSV